MNAIVTSNTYTVNLSKWFILLLPSLLLYSRFIAEITVISTVVFFLIYSLRTNNWKWTKRKWVLISIITALYFVLISSPLGENPSKSILTSITYIRWPFFSAAIAYWILIDEFRIKLFSIAVLANISFIVLDTFWQFKFGTDIFGIPKFDPTRLTGPLRNPVVGNMTLRVLFIGLYGISLIQFFNKSNRREFTTIMLLILVTLLFVFTTGERMSFVSAITWSSFFLIGLFFKHPSCRKQIPIWIVLILLSIASYSYINTEVYNREVMRMIDSLSNFRNDPYGKVFISGFELWKQYPITGMGYSNYQEVCTKTIEIGLYKLMCLVHPHNIYLQLLAETGIIGACLFIATIYSIFRESFIKAFKNKEWLLSSSIFSTFFVSLFPISANQAFTNNWSSSVIWCALGWCIASASAMSYKENKNE